MKNSNLKVQGFWYWASIFLIGITSALAFVPVFPLGDVFASSLKVSPDGFDWIAEGRALLRGVSGPWPVLRNTNLVLFSALDSLLGQTGIVFAALNSLGLLLQGISLFIVLGVVRHSHKVSFFVIFGYYLLPLHFLSLYVLAESIAVGTLMLSAAFFIKYLDSPRLLFLSAGAIFSLTSGLFQTYGLAPILVFAGVYTYRAIKFRQTRRANLEAAAVVIGSLATFLAVRFAWVTLIPHLSVPKQPELLELSLDMLSFYLNLLPFLLTPLFLAILVAFSAARFRRPIMTRKPLSSPSIQFSLALGMGLFSLAFLYQWEESRFSYTYLGALTMVVILLFAGDAGAGAGEENETSELPMKVFAWGMILIFSLYAPTDPWQPKIAEYSPFGIWPLTLSHSPQYLWYDELREMTCIPGTTLKSSEEISKLFDDLGITQDPYTRAIGIFAVKNCL